MASIPISCTFFQTHGPHLRKLAKDVHDQFAGEGEYNIYSSAVFVNVVIIDMATISRSKKIDASNEDDIYEAVIDVLVDQLSGNKLDTSHFTVAISLERRDETPDLDGYLHHTAASYRCFPDIVLSP